MVREHGAEHPSQWAAIASIASKLGCTAETLRRWVRQDERDTGHRRGLTTDERQRLTALEREVVELKRRDSGDSRRFANQPVAGTLHLLTVCPAN